MAIVGCPLFGSRYLRSAMNVQFHARSRFMNHPSWSHITTTIRVITSDTTTFRVTDIYGQFSRSFQSNSRLTKGAPKHIQIWPYDAVWLRVEEQATEPHWTFQYFLSILIWLAWLWHAFPACHADIGGYHHGYIPTISIVLSIHHISPLF